MLTLRPDQQQLYAQTRAAFAAGRLLRRGY